MDFLKRIADRILRPSSRLEDLPRFTGANLPEDNEETPRGARGRLRPRDVILNLPFMIGAVIVLGLFMLVLFGPIWAPENPYITGQHLGDEVSENIYDFPPFPPSPSYPLGTDQWGNDLLSLLMHGARNTLIACAFITMVRVIMGMIFGGLAGWNEGSNTDRIIMGSIGVITSVPMLISSMILIFALDIRRGLPVFIIALAVIGWTEIAQYIRSEFLILSKMPYIEGARSVGLSGLAVAVRHILPNVLPQLLVIACLEMGAVMMLLGELGFVGVYIGGGSRISVDLAATDTNVIYRLAEIPEWGAILAGGFRFLRSKPFVVFPPALAFFLSVVGFNTLGEGLRRLVAHSGFSTGFLLRKRMLLVLTSLSLATVFIINHSGAAPWFSKVAQSFNGDLAYQHIEELASFNGRGLNQTGGEQAAAYIAGKFETYDLEPGWRHTSYVYPYETQVVEPLDQPLLALVDSDGKILHAFRHQLDFGFSLEGHGGSGNTVAPLTFVGFRRGETAHTPEVFKGLDVRGRILIMLEESSPIGFSTEALIRGAKGILWITGDAHDEIRSQIHFVDQASDYMRYPQIPIFRIRSSVGQLLFADAGVTLNDLYSNDDLIDQSGYGWFTVDLDVNVAMSLTLSDPEDIQIPNIIGFLPGSDLDLADELVVLFATYDGLGTDPDGTVFQAANHNASGIGVMLEIARLWQEQGLGTRRSVLFVVWGGPQYMGFGAREFLDDYANFRRLPTRNPYARVTPTVLFQLDNMGAGGDSLSLFPGSNDRLINLLMETSSEVGIRVTTEDRDTQSRDDLVTHRIPWIGIQWNDSDIPPDQDVLERIDLEKLQNAGEAFALAIIRVVRQTSY